MFKLFKRRSQTEIDNSIYVEHDYTGGYRFVPWLLYRRPGTGLITGFTIAAIWKAWGHWIIIASIFIFIWIVFMWLKKVHELMKKGYH